MARRGILQGAKAALRTLDKTSQRARTSNGIPGTSLWTVANAALGDRQARRRVKAAPMEYARRYKPVRLYEEAQAARRQGRLLETLTRRAILFVATRPKPARILPGPY